MCNFTLVAHAILCNSLTVYITNKILTPTRNIVDITPQ